MAKQSLEKKSNPKGKEKKATKATVQGKQVAAAGRKKTVSKLPVDSNNQKQVKDFNLENKKKSESIIMFKNPFLEKLTHVHPATPFIIYIPVLLISLYFGVVENRVNIPAIVVYFWGGILTWTISEYSIHRFVFHPPYAESYLKGIYFYTHGIHHDAPEDATRLVMPPGASIPLSLLFFYLFQNLIGQNYLIFFAGFLTGYLIYDFLHFATHFYSFEYEWFRKLKKHHLVHHFTSPRVNFGVSSSLWDNIFSTKYTGKNSS